MVWQKQASRQPKGYLEIMFHILVRAYLGLDLLETRIKLHTFSV